ncbi:MAG: aldo/keto reductase [Gammaproteobacteria bacterium]|nr:aldo/keto reductase [Gammaproteobacteria bacterium]
MELRTLGASNIAVSPIGLGSVKFGRDQQVKYPRGFTIPDDRTVSNLLALAWELGINVIDTAPAYGNSEARLGQLLPKNQPWVIVTKVGEAFDNGQSSFDFSAAATRASVERSLKRLQREQLDVVLVHSDGDDMQIIHHQGVLAELQRLKEVGLVRAYGISTKTVAGGCWVAQHCDVIMVSCNRDSDDDRQVIAAAHQNSCGILVKKGLQSGHADPSAGGAGIDAAFKFIFSQPGISSAIIGTINPEHLRQNVAAVTCAIAQTNSQQPHRQ